MTDIAALASGVKAMRPFLPAKDFAVSRAFYEALGFQAHSLGADLCAMRLGAFHFLLQNYYEKTWAENTMMHLLVDDVQAWWTHIASLDLPGRHGVAEPRPPKDEPWGLTVAYVFDPSGVLWHVAEMTRPAG